MSHDARPHLLCLRNRPAVILLFIALAALGTRAVLYLDIDAFPDTTPVQVQVNAVAPSLTPPEIEQQIINPAASASAACRDWSTCGRCRSSASARWSPPSTSTPTCTSPASSWASACARLNCRGHRSADAGTDLDRPGRGVPLHRALGRPARSLALVREIHDWVIKPELRKVRGVAEINAWGDFVKQFHVVVDPMRLASHGLELSGLEEALRRGNRAVGGGQVTTAGETVLVQAAALAQSAEEIGRMVVAVRGGAAVTVADVAEVREGAEIRRGAASANGRGEVLLGLGFMLMGENSHAVTRALKQRLEEVRRFLPADIQVETFYDRTELVDQVIHTIRENLLAGAALVIAVLFAFLGNLRAGLIVAASIPLCFLFASSYMLQAGIAASLLSLGAMDFGLTADNVIIVENCMRRLRHGDTASRIDVVRDATLEVRKPALFGELIMVLVFVPLLALEGVEGRMFRPMALTMIATLLGSMILSVTLTPVLASLLLPRVIREREPLLVRIARRACSRSTSCSRPASLSRCWRRSSSRPADGARCVSVANSS
ncbi:MAG: efflux RND transporter permease subunit [Kiritimatiellia bacterium]